MRFEGAETIKAPRSKVWNFVTDPQAVCGCVPGFNSLEIISPKHKFRANASIEMGTLNVDFSVLVTYDVLTVPTLANFRAVATASGGNGEARVTSYVELEEAEDDSTVLKWAVNMTVMGLIANIAARFGSGLAKSLTSDFFNCVRNKLEASSDARPL